MANDIDITKFVILHTPKGPAQVHPLVLELCGVTADHHISDDHMVKILQIHALAMVVRLERMITERKATTQSSVGD